GPTVLRQERLPGPSRDDGLDSDYETFRKNLVGIGIGVIGYPGLFVNGASDTVAAQFTNDRKARPAHFALYGSAYVGDAESGSGNKKRFVECTLGTGGKPTLVFGNFSDGHSDRGVGHKAVFLDGHIQLQQVPILHDAVAGNSVYGFVVQADAV